MTDNQLRMSDKWNLVVEAYNKLKNGDKSTFKTVNDICIVYKVQRKDIRKYYERWLKNGRCRESLLPYKRGPKPGQLKILSKDEERTIIRIRRKLGSSEFEINQLIRDHNKLTGNFIFRVHPSVSTIYRTFKRYPLNKKRKARIKRYEKNYPGELVHVDTHNLAKTLIVNRQKYYLLGIIDDCTRLCYTEIISNLKAADVTKAFFNGYRWFYEHGVKIECVLTDNGIEFTSYTSQKAKDTHFFETMLNIFGLKHKYTRPYRPQTNGKIERFWKTLMEECLMLELKSSTLEELERNIAKYMYRYNYERIHGGIKYLTPLEKLKYVTEIMK